MSFRELFRQRGVFDRNLLAKWTAFQPEFAIPDFLALLHDRTEGDGDLSLNHVESPLRLAQVAWSSLDLLRNDEQVLARRSAMCWSRLRGSLRVHGAGPQLSNTSSSAGADRD